MDDIENENPDGEGEPSPRKRVVATVEANGAVAPRNKRAKVEKTVARSEDGDGGLDFATEVAGRIASIELENFMCHGHLKLSFDVHSKNCFYIGGPNGSGKSALFAAFNLGLGGRGNQNDRGNSVKGYIKSGKSRARIIITLTNRGEGAIPEYGDYIVVERTINQAASTYKLKSRGGHMREELISSKKSDLDRLLSKFKIDLSNPVFWMSQDRSRQFLTDLDPSKMFSIFMKATDLEKTEHEYRETQAKLMDIMACEAITKEDLDRKKQKLDETREQIALATKLLSLRTALEGLDWMLMWAPSRDVNMKLDGLKEKKKKHQEEKELLKHRLRVHCETLQEHSAELEQLSEQISVGKEGNDYYTEQAKTIKQQQLGVRQEESQLQDAKARLKADRKKAHEKVAQMEDQIEEAEERAANDAARNEIEELRRKVAQLKDEESELIEKRRLAEQEAELAKGAMAGAEEDASQASRSERELTGRISEQKRLLEQSDATQKDKLARFGRQIPNILHLLKQFEAKFEKPPRGPLGMFVKVRDPEWAFAIEEALWALMNTFIFNSKKDEDVFHDLMRAKGIDKFAYKTIVTKFDLPPHPTRNQEPSPEWNTVLRAIEVDDPVARNSLIDMASIESILLLDDKQQPQQLMDGNCPERCRNAYTKNGNQVYGRTARGTGQYRVYTCHKQPRAVMLGGGVVCNRGEVLAEIQRLQQQLPILKQQMAEAQAEYRRLRGQSDAQFRSQQQIEGRLRAIRDEIRATERKVDAYVGKDDDDIIPNLRAAIEEIKKSATHKEGEIERIEEKIEGCRVKMTELKESLAEINREFTAHRDEYEPIQHTVAGLRAKIDQINATIQTQEDAIKRLDETYDQFDLEWVALQREKEEADELAAQTDNLPVPDGFTSPPDLKQLPSTRDVEKEKRATEQKIEIFDQRVQSAPVSQDEFQIASTDFVHSKAQFKELKKLNNHLRRSLALRLGRFPVMQHVIITRLQDVFQGLMTYCKFTGQLMVNVLQRKLKVNVERGAVQSTGGRLAPRNEAVEDLKGLSGGERSYTSACLIMALWGVMEAPFRLMDEFDVFMDMLNRKVIMDLLINMATNKFPHHQFIFFTPQGVKECTKDGVEIFELAPIRD